MSMILALTTVEDATIRRLLEEPEQVWRVLAPDDASMHPPGQLDLVEGEGQSIDLDKAWHGIHYLLAGTEWEGTGPAAFLLAGGKEVGDVDVGYGPARALSAAELQQIGDAGQLPAEYPGWMFERQGANRRKQIADASQPRSA